MSDEDFTSEELDRASEYLWDARQNDPPLEGHLLRAVALLQRQLSVLKTENAALRKGVDAEKTRCLMMSTAATRSGNEVERLRDIINRIAHEITAVAPDSGRCDSIGEIYHLLREYAEKDGAGGELLGLKPGEFEVVTWRKAPPYPPRS